MTDHDRHGCGRVGSWIGVLCAALGVLSAYAMVRALDIGWIVGIPKLPLELILGLVALFVAAALLGRKAGVFLCKRQNDLAMNVVVGIGVAFGSIAIAVWTGTLVGLISEIPSLQPPDPVGILLVIFGPLLIICFYGGIPAALLGVLYGFLVRRQLRKLGP